MNGYLLGVIGTVLLSAIITAILPEGRTAGTVKAITRLACIIAIISPILRFFKTGEMEELTAKNSSDIFSQSVIDGDSAFIQYYSEMRIAEAERVLKEEIKETYGINADVKLVWTVVEECVADIYQTESIKILQIRIRINEQSDEEVLENMWNDLSKNYCSEVLIE